MQLQFIEAFRATGDDAHLPCMLVNPATMRQPGNGAQADAGRRMPRPTQTQTQTQTHDGGCACFCEQVSSDALIM
jgi:hypothetical protein